MTDTSPKRKAKGKTNRLQRQLERIKLLVRSCGNPRLHLGFHELGQALHETLGPIAGIEQFSLFLSRSSGRPFSLITCGGVAESEFSDVTIAPGEGTVGAVAVTGTPFFAARIRRRLKPVESQTLGGHPVMACLPIRTSTETVGLLIVHKMTTKTIQAEEREMLTILAGQIGPVVETILMREEMVRYSAGVEEANTDIARTTRDLELQIEHLHTLSLFAVTLHSSLDLHEVFGHVRKLSMTFLCIDKFHIIMAFEGEWITYHGAADTDADQNELNEFIGRHSRIVERVMVSGKAYSPGRRDYKSPEDGPVMCLPLKVKDETVGVFLIESLAEGHTEISDDNMELMKLLTEQAALAITAGYLYNRVEKMAVTDGLTGLYDRRHIEHLVRREISRAKRYDEHVALAMADVDDFKLINDTYGHPFGDTVLKEIGAAFRAACREGDIVGRYGGEEFLFILPKTDRAGAAALGERIRTAAESLALTVRGKRFNVTVSVGAAVRRSHRSWEELLKSADDALYTAKRQGKNCVVVAADNEE